MRKVQKTNKYEFFLLEKTKEELRKHSLLKDVEKIIVSISGGADSVCLLHLLHRLKDELGFKLEALHFNFSLRGKESLRDEKFVSKLASRLKVPLVIVRPKRANDKKKIKNTQLWARNARLKHYRQILAREEKVRIALAHNMDDQVETFLLRLVRGSGVRGLSGMGFVSMKALIRPLLGVSREEIRSYLEKNKFSFVEDSTNIKNIYSRNWIRNRLIPVLTEHRFHGDFKKKITETMELIAMEEEFLNGFVKENFKKLIKKRSKRKLDIDLIGFRTLPMMIKFRVLRESIADICGTLEGFSLSHIKNIERLTKSRSGSKSLSLPCGLKAFRRYDELSFELEKKEEDTEFIYSLKAPCSLKIKELNKTLKLSFHKKTGKPAKGEILFDYDKFKNEIKIRNFRNGDRIMINKKEGIRKVKNLFIGRKISREIRRKIPFIMDGENIAGILGIAIDCRYKIGAHSVNILKVALSGDF